MPLHVLQSRSSPTDVHKMMMKTQRGQEPSIDFVILHMLQFSAGFGSQKKGSPCVRGHHPASQPAAPQCLCWAATEKERKEFALFSDHNSSLLRWQPGAGLLLSAPKQACFGHACKDMLQANVSQCKLHPLAPVANEIHAGYPFLV